MELVLVALSAQWSYGQTIEIDASLWCPSSALVIPAMAVPVIVVPVVVVLYHDRA